MAGNKEFFLSIGSNIRPGRHIPQCIEKLRTSFKLVRFSSIYETDPIGCKSPEKFWNMAALIQTELDLAELDRHLKSIEADLGRTRSPNDRFAPRTIDIDILPSPDFWKQPFVVIPLAEIAPGERNKETGETFEELARRFIAEGIDYRRVNLPS